MATLPLALVFLLLETVRALEFNVTVDDQDEQIAYSGANWTTLLDIGRGSTHLNQSLLQNGTSHSANGSDNGATFNFTGTAIWVRGVLSIAHWRGLPNVTFTLDGIQRSLSSAISNDAHGFQYNLTLYEATGLSNAPHSLTIETHDSLLFTLDSITYTTTSTLITAANSTETTQSLPAQSTFPYPDSNDSSGSSSPHAAVVGGVVGGIFGAFLLAGLIGLFIIRRSKQKRDTKSSRHRRPHRRGGGGRGGGNNGSGSGGSSGRRQSELERQMKRQDRGIEFKYSGPKPVDVPWIPPVKDDEPSRYGGEQRSAPMSTYAASSTSEGGRTTDLYHAITTDSPHPIKPRALELQWGERSKSEKHYSTQTEGSTLDAEGVLEHVMNHAPPPDFSTRSPTYRIGDHPFRAGNTNV